MGAPGGLVAGLLPAAFLGRLPLLADPRELSWQYYCGQRPSQPVVSSPTQRGFCSESGFPCGFVPLSGHRARVTSLMPATWPKLSLLSALNGLAPP